MTGRCPFGRNTGRRLLFLKRGESREPTRHHDSVKPLGMLFGLRMFLSANRCPLRRNMREFYKAKSVYSVWSRRPSAMAAQSRSGVAGMSTWRTR